MAEPNEIYSLEHPTDGWAFLRNGFINHLTKIFLVTSPSATAGTVVEIGVEHKRGRATGHITVQAVAFKQLVIAWLERLGLRVVKADEPLTPELRELLQSCYDLIEDPSNIDEQPEWREAAVNQIAAYLADHPVRGYCPGHGGEVSGEDELTSLADHGKCIACFKAWQLSDAQKFKDWIDEMLGDLVLKECQEVRIFIPADMIDGCYTLDLESGPNIIAGTWFTETDDNEKAQEFADELEAVLVELGFDVLLEWSEMEDSATI